MRSVTDAEVDVLLYNGNIFGFFFVHRWIFIQQTILMVAHWNVYDPPKALFSLVDASVEILWVHCPSANTKKKSEWQIYQNRGHI